MKAETAFNVIKSLTDSEHHRFKKMYDGFYEACGMVSTEPKKILTDEEATEFLLTKIKSQ